MKSVIYTALVATVLGSEKSVFTVTIRYDTTEEINVDSKAEYTA